MGKSKKKHFLLIAVMLIATGLGIWVANYSMMNTSSLPILADIGTDFELTAADETRISLKDYRDHIVIVFFGYTSCPDVCPTGLYTLKQVMHKLGKDSRQVQVLLISVDPERDSAERLREYVSYFHRDFIGLTGTLEEITRVAKAYLTDFMKEPPLPDGGYQVSHGVFFYLLDKQGRVRALHDPTSTTAQIVMDVRSLLAEHKEFVF
jgi:protein SCO1/2